MKQDYIKDIRNKVGHEPLILTFASGVLVNESNEILLQKRSDFNSWGLPGGALEFGETAPEACKREFLEETGLRVEIESLLGVSTKQIQHYPNGDITQSVVISFIVKLVGMQAKNLDLSSETLALAYFGQNNLPEIFNEQHKNCIKKFYSGDYPYYD